MSKPAFYLVIFPGGSSRFETRTAARIFAALEKLKGNKVIIKPIGF